MSEIEYRGRRAHILSNGTLEIIVTVEGGHIAEVRDKATGLNPLWAPPWPTMEPSHYDAAKHRQYGGDSESKLLAGILGHNLCLDTFGGPLGAEAGAGMTVHGEASVSAYDIAVKGDTLSQAVELKEARLRFTRDIQLPAGARVATISETVENLSAWDWPIAWTEHATLGPPFLEKGRTQFRVTATRSKVNEADFTGGKGHTRMGAEFDWPMVPCVDGSFEDLRVFTNRPVSGAFTTHLMDAGREQARFTAWSPAHGFAFGYVWQRKDFPWLGIWEENHSRLSAPWNGVTLTRGMEFGVSPFPESRRAMIQRGGLFGVPGYCWAPARQKVSVRYRVFLVPASECVEPVECVEREGVVVSERSPV